MLRLALAGETHCEIDDQELRRGGVSYTIDTVREVARRCPGLDLAYLIGADHLAKLPAWREAESLARLVEFVVLPRPGEHVLFPGPPFSSTCSSRISDFSFLVPASRPPSGRTTDSSLGAPARGGICAQ